MFSLSLFPFWFLQQGVLLTSVFPFSSYPSCLVTSGAMHSPNLSLYLGASIIRWYTPI